MNLKTALEKIAALEKRIEELEKRQPVVINNYPTASPAPVLIPTVAPYYPQWPFGDTIITCSNPVLNADTPHRFTFTS